MILFGQQRNIYIRIIRKYYLRQSDIIRLKDIYIK